MYVPLSYEQMSVLEVLLRREMNKTSDEILDFSSREKMNSFIEMRIAKRRDYMNTLVQLYYHIRLFEKLD